MMRALVAFLLALAIFFANLPPTHAEVTGETWAIATKDFKLGYSVAFLQAFYLLPPDKKSADDFTGFTVFMSRCISTKGISPGQMIASLNAFLSAHPERKAEPLFGLATDALFNVCTPVAP